MTSEPQQRQWPLWCFAEHSITLVEARNKDFVCRLSQHSVPRAGIVPHCWQVSHAWPQPCALALNDSAEETRPGSWGNESQTRGGWHTRHQVHILGYQIHQVTRLSWWYSWIGCSSTLRSIYVTPFLLSSSWSWFIPPYLEGQLLYLHLCAQQEPPGFLVYEIWGLCQKVCGNGAKDDLSANIFLKSMRTSTKATWCVLDLRCFRQKLIFAVQLIPFFNKSLWTPTELTIPLTTWSAWDVFQTIPRGVP